MQDTNYGNTAGMNGEAAQTAGPEVPMGATMGQQQQQGAYQAQYQQPQQAAAPQYQQQAAYAPAQQIGISGGKKALYAIIGFLFPIIAMAMLLISNKPSAYGHREGDFRETMKWTAIGCGISLVLGVIMSAIAMIFLPGLMAVDMTTSMSSYPTTTYEIY